jgi:hypothetical protein
MAIATLRKEIAQLKAQIEAHTQTAGLRGRTPPQKEARQRHAADPVAWIDECCKTYDPRLPDKLIDFKLFDRQKEFVRWLQERKALRQGGICEKSRGVGVSFLCAAMALHDWLFVPGSASGFGSYKEEYVDQKGNPKSIFEKLRIMLYHLPPGYLPAGFKRREHDCFRRLVNPQTGATITGEVGDNIGRGNRVGVYYLDEAAFLEHPEMIDSAMVEATDVRIDVSTPNGPGNPFAQRRFSGNWPVFSFHYRDDPRKDAAWAEAKRKECGAVVFAREYDIDYSASLAGIIIPGAWVRAAVNLDLPRSVKGTAGLDIGEEGNNLSVLIPRWGPVAGQPISWGKLLTTQTAWRARDEMVRLSLTELFYDADGVGLGVKGTLNTSERPLPFKARGIHTGGSPTDARWPDKQTSKEKFTNLKAELWWRLRTRFEKTYEFVTQGIQHKLEEMISIPDCPQLIAELSMPLSELRENGKIAVESKEALRRRGIPSPDFADTLVLSEACWVVPRPEFWMA